MTKVITRFALRIGIVVAIVVVGYLWVTSISTFNANMLEEDTCENDSCERKTVIYGHLVAQIEAMCVDDPLSETGCDSRFSRWSGRLECDTYQCDSD